MADLIKKIKIKKQDGSFTDYIPIGADAANVETSDGESVELKLKKKISSYNSINAMKTDDTIKINDFIIISNENTIDKYNIIANDSGITIDNYNAILLNNHLIAKRINDDSTFDKNYIDVTQPPKEYSGIAVNAQAADNSPALHNIIIWALKNQTNPVLYFPKGNYYFQTSTFVRLTQSLWDEMVANKIRITGSNQTKILWNSKPRNRTGWFEIYQEPNVILPKTISIEIDHLYLQQNYPYEDGTYTRLTWIWVYNSDNSRFCDVLNVHDNYFVNECGTAVLNRGARQTMVENNIFYNCYESCPHDDSSFILHPGSYGENLIIRKNFMYVDDTKKLCGAAICSEYQTGVCDISENYIYGYERGIHIEISHRHCTQYVRSNTVENCLIGIVVWNARSSIVLEGNYITTKEDFSYSNRLAPAYETTSPIGITFNWYCKSYSTTITNNTIQLDSGGNPFRVTGGHSDDGGEDYKNKFNFQTNWTVKYNKFITAELINGTIFYTPTWSIIENNVWYMKQLNLANSWHTKINNNIFYTEELLGPVNGYTTTGPYIDMYQNIIDSQGLGHYIDTYDPDTRGIERLKKYAPELSNNIFNGIGNKEGVAEISKLLVYFHDNIVYYEGTQSITIPGNGSGVENMGFAENNIIFSKTKTWEAMNILQARINNRLYLWDEDTQTYIYQNNGQSNYQGCKSYYNYRLSKYCIVFRMNSFPYSNAVFTSSSFQKGDRCYMTNWTLGDTTHPEYYECITDGVGNNAQWVAVYNTNTIQTLSI